MKEKAKTRTVDIWKALPVVRALEDATERDDDDDLPMQAPAAPAPSGRGTRSLERSASSSSSSGAMTGAPAPAAMERAKSITAVVAQAKAKEIPVPQIDTSAEYDTIMVEASYKLPDSYIRTKKLPILPAGVEIEGLEYNLELEDEEWLNGHKVIGPKGELAGALDADRMEKMIDELEKATGAAEAIPLADAESVLEARMGMQPIGSNKTVIAEVWTYWTGKRAQLKKPLLRRFWPVTSINDSNPHLVFRPREKERYKLRKHRKNDGEAYRRLQLLRRDFGQVQNLLQMVKRREQLKLASLKLQEEQYLQALAEMCGQQRKPKIPKEVVPPREELKLKIRLPPLGMDGLPRKKRPREGEMEGMEGGRRPPQEINPEQERLHKPVGWGFKEKDGPMATPDYIPSFMEDFKFRYQGRPLAHRPFLPFSDECSTTYGWKASSQGQGGKIGHVQSGLVSAPRCPPINYDGEEDDSVRYRCRARIARGGRMVFDRVPIAPSLPLPTAQPPAMGGGGGQGGGGEEENAQPEGPHAPLPTTSILLSAGTELNQLDKYPTLDLVSGALFKYPARYREIERLVDDTEEEVLEINPAMPTDPDPFLTLPPRPKPPETDAVVILRFALPV